jgi:glycosyltransferase involved in cell wall biosynthesis
MKIYLNNANENWIVDRLKKEFCDYNKHIKVQGVDIVDNPYDADILWVIASWVYNNVPSTLLYNKKVITTIHHITPSKFNPRDIATKNSFTDIYHCTNQTTADFLSKYTNKPIVVIPFWYDQNKWYQRNKKDSRKILNLTDDNFYIGSFQRDTEGYDLTTPKLEKGPDKFCDFVEKISKEKDNVFVLLGGTRRQYVINRLENSNIRYRYIENAPIDTLFHMYSSLDLYVVGSRIEGGPQAIIECSAMKVPIVSTNVGLAPYILCDNCIFDVSENIYLPKQKDIEENYNNTLKYRLDNLNNVFLNMVLS